MDNKTIGIIFGIMGIVSFLYSFGETINYITLILGLVLVIGGILFAKYAKD